MEWVKALHVIAVIAWMAGLLYLPRLFVYHCGATLGSELSDTLKIMERRLYRVIMTPAMVAAWVFGLWLVLGFKTVGWDWSLGFGWVWAKAILVIFLTVYHFKLGKHLALFASDGNNKSQRYFRVINEIPTLIMIGIVIFVIVRPF